jgi:hypothetical protein
LSYFHLGVFLIRNKICRVVPPVSLSLCAGPARQRAASTWCAMCCAHAIKAPANRVAVQSVKAVAGPKPHRRLAVGAPPDCACPSTAVSAVRPRLAARSRSAPPPVRSSRRCLPRVDAPPRFTLKSAATPHHLLSMCAGARREEPPYRRSFDCLRHRDSLHGEQSPEHPIATFFSGYTCA